VEERERERVDGFQSCCRIKLDLAEVLNSQKLDHNLNTKRAIKLTCIESARGLFILRKVTGARRAQLWELN